MVPRFMRIAYQRRRGGSIVSRAALGNGATSIATRAMDVGLPRPFPHFVSVSP
jgi:hypothetical protein